jgi:CTP synthase (UTP-ammonia lyase)
LPDHPFFMATLFQPQVGSVAGRPLHPIIRAFAAAV